MDRGEPSGRCQLPAHAPGAERPSDRAGGCDAARDDAVVGRRQSGGTRDSGLGTREGTSSPEPRVPSPESRIPAGMTPRTLFAKVWDPHVLATQCLVVMRPKTMEVRFDGAPAPGVTAKDLILALIGRIGTAGATGHVIEYTGEAIRGLSMEGRMTVCNMSIEAGARAGMIAPDETTFAYLAGRPRAPEGERLTRAVARWGRLRSDDGATYDTRVTLDASAGAPQVTWGTNPGMVADITGLGSDRAGCARCAATSNRNFEGRQGRGGRTHLMSPAMAAAAGIAGHLVDIRSWT